jgi:CRISPR-associated protein Cas2
VLVVVSYDVATTTREGRRRLRRVAKVCLNHGQRVQNSVFECLLNNQEWTQLRLHLLREYEPEEDSLRFYFLGNNWHGNVEHHGIKKVVALDEPLIA